MSKRSKSKPVKKERACIRCGCTEARACVGGCNWLERYFDDPTLARKFALDICSACLTVHEDNLLDDLLESHTALRDAKDANDRLQATVIDWLHSPENPANKTPGAA